MKKPFESELDLLDRSSRRCASVKTLQPKMHSPDRPFLATSVAHDRHRLRQTLRQQTSQVIRLPSWAGFSSDRRWQARPHNACWMQITRSTNVRMLDRKL